MRNFAPWVPNGGRLTPIWTQSRRRSRVPRLIAPLAGLDVDARLGTPRIARPALEHDELVVPAVHAGIL